MNGTVSSLPILIVNVHSRCNCRCAMCDIWRTPENREFPPAQLEAQLPDMMRLGVKWVVFSGGEPLMHSSLFEMAATLRARGIRITILTTGLLLARHAADVASNIDDVIVSLDGPPEIHDRIRGVPSAFERLRDGVETLRAIRPAFPVTARCTVQKLNHADIARTVQTANSLHLDSISFLAADLTSTAFRRDPVWPLERQNTIALASDQIATLESQIETLIAQPDPVLADRPEHLRRIVSHFRAHLGLTEPSAPRCNAPWVSAVIETDGSVRPCFFHRSVGHLGAGTLSAALNGPEAVIFRQNLRIDENPTCRNCVCSLHLNS